MSVADGFGPVVGFCTLSVMVCAGCVPYPAIVKSSGMELGAALKIPVSALEEQSLAWLSLVLTPGMGPTRCFRVMRQLRGAGRIFSASLTELEAAGLPAGAAQFVFNGRARRRPKRR